MMRNIYKWDNELNELVVTQVESKTLDDIKRVINDKRSDEVIDTFIELYLYANEPNQFIADEWYTEHLKLLTLDPEEIVEVTFIDENGDEQMQTVPNAYLQTKQARQVLEDNNEWLKSYRGLDSSDRPDYTPDVGAFKTENAEMFTPLVKAKGVEFKGKHISLNESNQHGLADISVMLDKAASLGVTTFPINIKLDSINGSVTLTVDSQDEFDQLFLTFGQARQQFF